MERKDEENWMRKCMCMEVEGARTMGKPKKTWVEVVRNDMKELSWTSVDALDHHAWKRKIVGDTC